MIDFEALIEKLKNKTQEELETEYERLTHTKFYDRWVEKVHNLNTEKRKYIVNKLLVKYNSDDYYKRYYKRGIEPDTELFWLYYRYARKYGKSIPNNGVFVTSTYEIDGYIIERLNGQGSVINVSPSRNYWFRANGFKPTALPFKSYSDFVIIKYDDGDVRIDRYDFDKDNWEDNDTDYDLEHIKYWCNIPSLEETF